jgi:hypothetical protein
MSTPRQQPHDPRDNSRAASPETRHAQAQRGWVTPGQVVMGPGFYVWDESPEQAREWGVELANASLARQG